MVIVENGKWLKLPSDKRSPQVSNYIPLITAHVLGSAHNCFTVECLFLFLLYNLSNSMSIGSRMCPLLCSEDGPKSESSWDEYGKNQ